MSASCFLQSPSHSSTGQVPILEHETFFRTVLGTPRTCRKQLADMQPPLQPHFLGQHNMVFTTMWLQLNDVLGK